MKTYKIRFDASDRDHVLELIRDFSSDIVIDNIEDSSVTITIEREDDESDKMYSDLQEAVLRNTEIKLDDLKKSNQHHVHTKQFLAR